MVRKLYAVRMERNTEGKLAEGIWHDTHGTLR